MSMLVPKKCPMCKEKPRVTREGGVNMENCIVYKVECTCGTSNGWHTRGAAVMEWNEKARGSDNQTKAGQSPSVCVLPPLPQKTDPSVDFKNYLTANPDLLLAEQF